MPPDVQGGNPSAAPILSNLLSNTLQTWQSGDTQKKGILIGAGLPPIPANLSERILKWEYVKMADLIPYIWSLLWSTGQPAKPCRQVRDIGMWLQCSASCIAVLSTRFPKSIPNLLAYMVTTLGAFQEFEGSGWVTYDTSYRQQMAITGNRDWSQSNGSLFTKCFTARARLVEHCKLCLSTTHKARDCPGAVQDDRNMSKRLKAIEAAVTTPSSTSKGMARPNSLEIC